MPRNVLLVSKFSPEVVDFGLAMLYNREITHASMTCGKMKLDATMGESQLPKRVWEKFEMGGLSDFLRDFGIEDGDKMKAVLFCTVALWCIQYLPEARSSMIRVVQMLEGMVEVMTPPNLFQHLISTGVNLAVSKQTTSIDSTSSAGIMRTNSKECTPIMKMVRTKNLFLHWGGEWQDPWEDIGYTHDFYINGKQVRYLIIDGDHISMLGGPSNDVEVELGRPCIDVNEGKTGGVGANKGEKKGKYEGWSSAINAETKTENVVEDVDEIEDWTRWTEFNPDCLDADEGYYSTHSSQQGDDRSTQEDLDRVDDALKNLTSAAKDIFSIEDGVQFKKKPDVNYDELKIGMMWPTMFETRKFIRHYGIANKFEFYQVKKENYRVRLKCSDEDCQWMFYARRMHDGQTFKLKGTSNLIHNYKWKGGDTNKLANATWVTNEVEQLVRFVRTARPFDVQENIRVRFGVDISCYTAWNAWTTCMERIVGSYDEGYIIMHELVIQVLKANLGSITTCNIDLDTNQWKTTCIAYKASIDGFLNGCRPVLGLDGCFLKGKYEGVCLSIIGLDGNNKLLTIAIFFCRSECFETWERLQTHITKMSRQYGQFKIEGTTDNCFVAIASSGQRWKLNLNRHECQCKEWQVTGLPCAHAVSALIPMRHPWIDYCSEYHRVSAYLATYKDPIHAVDDSSEWGM
ncbi:hypothetical protein GIB67_037058, partial [Kingdonia uniflora]